MAVVRAARWLSWALVAAAAAGGSLLDTARAADPKRVGPYHLIVADFHVHAFPGDGALPPWELAREASRRGLHAIVVSNHNQMLAPKIMPGLFSADEAGGAAHPPSREARRRTRRSLGEGGHGPRLPLLIPAQEVTTPRFHLVAVGITSTIDWRLPDVEMIDAIHAQGGVAVAAHPVGRYWRGSDAMLARLDGAEVAHPLTESLASGRDELSAFFTRVHAVNPGVAPIGSSDFHMIAPLGLCRTYVFAESVTVTGVLDAIRAGRTVAEDKQGALYGDPTLIQTLNQSGAAAMVPPNSRWVWVSAAMALIGLLALITRV
ncbi:MAG: CehA/McbA family metallohydrolase [Vicinamibacterales bacterium]